MYYVSEVDMILSILYVNQILHWNRTTNKPESRTRATTIFFA